jgi:hypothetical protein
VIASYVPSVNVVRPGSRPLVQLAPLLVLVANAIAVAPPSKKRPACAAATIVDPEAKLSGSTIVWC